MSSASSVHPELASDLTTFLSTQIERAAEKFGSHNVFIASFTRASAQELVRRELPVPRSQIGTLHAHCYRALGSPEIAEMHVREWNDFIKSAIPTYRMTPTENISLDEKMEFDAVTEGDALFSELQIARARMVPFATQHLVGFNAHWEAFKLECGYLDFTDMIEMALRDLDFAPGAPQVGFFDEAQDFTRLELSLVRKWARSMEFALIAGDDDQCLYDFKGSTPDAFLDPPIPDSQKRVLGQSYRVPRRVQAMATTWIQQLSRRENKPYRARDAEGEVRRLAARWREPQPLISDAEAYIAAGKSVMFLASCSYMLDDLRDELKAQAVPFCNPYRRRRGDWNPLAPRKGASSTERLLSFLRPQKAVWDNPSLWTRTEFSRWASGMRAENVFQRNQKKVAQGLDGGQLMTLSELQTLMEPGALNAALHGDVGWFSEHSLPDKQRAIQFPIDVYRKRGAAALRKPPAVIIGTVHSVKGGEADVVYLFPDVSPRAYKGWQDQGAEHDAVVRMFYVGMTRARESLIVTNPSGFEVPMPVEAFAFKPNDRRMQKIG